MANVTITVEALTEGDACGQRDCHKQPADSSAQRVVTTNGLVTPGSLADQYNRDADRKDPISFFYPCGLLY
jgi:hypothetical protein